MNEKYCKTITGESNCQMVFIYIMMLFDDSGCPYDYEIVEANQVFEQMTGLSRADIIGKRIGEIIPNKNETFNWSEFHNAVASGGVRRSYEQFSRVLHHWYKLLILAPLNEDFITVIGEIAYS